MKHNPWKHAHEEVDLPAVELSYEVMEVSEPMADLLAEFLDECGYGDAWEASFDPDKATVELTMPSALADCVCDFLDEKIDEEERESLMGNPWAGKEGKLKFVRFTGSDAIKGNSAEQEQTDLRSTGRQELDAAEEDKDYDEGGEDEDDDEEEGGDGAEQDRTRNNPAEAHHEDDEEEDNDDDEGEDDEDDEDDRDDESEKEDDDDDEEDADSEEEDDDDDDDSEEDDDDDDDEEDDEPKHRRHEESDNSEATLCEDTRPHKVVRMGFGKAEKAKVVFTGTFMEMFDWARKNDYTRIDNHASPYGFWWQKKGEVGTEYWIDPVGISESEDQPVKTVLVTFPRSRAGEFQKLIQRAGGDPKQVHVTETKNRREILTATISESLSKRIGPSMGEDFIIE